MIGPNNSLVQMIFFLYFSSDVEIKFRKFEIWECRRCAVITQSPLGILYIILPNRIKTTTIVITGQQKMKNDICFVISSVSLSSHVETITRWAQTQRRRHVFSNRVLSIVKRSGPGLKCEEQKILLLSLLAVYKFTAQNKSEYECPKS